MNTKFPRRFGPLHAAARAIAVGALAAMTSLGAMAADTYPSRPVRIIVPFAAGGSGDAVTRLVAQKLSVRMGQPFVIENKTGAGGAAGESAASKSAPDGYTLAFISTSHSLLSAMRNNLNFDPAKDLTPIAQICSTPYVFLARKDAPFNTVREFVAFAKANPGSTNLASAGVGTLTHLLPAWITAELGLEVNHVPYNGTAPAMNALVAGQVDIYFDPVATTMQQFRAGKVKALATTDGTRAKALGDIPTLVELGYPIKGTTWFGLMAPTGVPKSIIERLNKEVNAVLQDLEVRQRLDDQNFNVESGSVQQFGDFIALQTKTWTKIIKDNKIQGLD